VTQSRGTERERRVVNVLRGLNYLPASLRHLKGPGDILAIPLATDGHRPLLVEVKGTTDLPWASTWGPEERGAMLLAGDVWNVEPILAWYPPGLRDGPIWLDETQWP
jgi:hypothetical protein